MPWLCGRWHVAVVRHSRVIRLLASAWANLLEDPPLFPVFAPGFNGISMIILLTKLGYFNGHWLRDNRLLFH
jgi:hypothetical protein